MPTASGKPGQRSLIPSLPVTTRLPSSRVPQAMLILHAPTDQEALFRKLPGALKKDLKLATADLMA